MHICRQKIGNMFIGIQWQRFKGPSVADPAGILDWAFAIGLPFFSFGIRKAKKKHSKELTGVKL